MEKKYFLLFILFFTVAATVLTSCNKLNPTETIPCYGHIDKISLTTNYPTEGSDSSEINDAWVYVDDNPVGAFELPCTFPIIAGSGTHTITIFAGVKEDGVASSHTKYPFYSAYTINTTITQGATTKFTPATSYTSFAHFSWLEDFNGSSISITSDSNKNWCDTNMFIVQNPNPKVPDPDVYEGTGSGEVVLDNIHSLYLGKSDTFYLPNNGNAVFLEMNYKADAVFMVGLYPYGGTQPIAVVYVNSTSTWKKMYINLQPTLTMYPSVSRYHVCFNMNWNGGPPIHLFLDNIKLIRQP